MRFISFFAGIGGIDLGLERAGHRCVGQCEIDPDALRVLENHWPDVPRFGDITKVNPDELPEADLWCGGFPCTDISNAGKQAGIHGPHSGLFFDWMRAVRMVRPQYLLMENVAALLHQGMGEVCGELAEGGYDAEWDCIPACAVGAPHRRDRVFIIADTDSHGTERGKSELSQQNPGLNTCGKAKVEPVADPYAQGQSQSERHVEEERRRTGDSDKTEVEPSSDPDSTRLPARIFRQGPTSEFAEDCRTSLGTHVGRSWAAEPGESWLDDGLPSGMAEQSSRLFGNAVVVRVAEYIGRLLPPTPGAQR